MRLNYKKVGDFIKQSKLKNDDGRITRLLGVNLDKEFMPSVANLNGVDLTSYKVIKRGQFGCKLMSVGRDGKVPISRLVNYEKAIISSAYFVFEVKDETILDPEYLMMWFSRSESDRFQWFQSGGDIRGRITWEDFGNLPINIPSIETQQEIVNEYHTITKRIDLNEQTNQKLEETAQVLYKHWFVDFEFPTSAAYAASVGKPEIEGKPYKSSGGDMVYNKELDREIPEGWKQILVKDFCGDMKSGGTPNRGVTEYWNAGDIPWIKTGELKNSVLINTEEYITELGLKSSSARILPINTVLVAMYGQGETKGQVGYLKIPASTNQACCAMICNDEVRSTFLYYHFRVNRKEIVSIAIGGAQPNLSKDIIENISIIEPPEKVLEMHPFVEIMNQREKIQKENFHLCRLQDLLLSKMATVGSEEEIVNQ